MKQSGPPGMPILFSLNLIVHVNKNAGLFFLFFFQFDVKLILDDDLLDHFKSYGVEDQGFLHNNVGSHD